MFYLLQDDCKPVMRKGHARIDALLHVTKRLFQAVKAACRFVGARHQALQAVPY